MKVKTLPALLAALLVACAPAAQQAPVAQAPAAQAPAPKYKIADPVFAAAPGAKAYYGSRKGYAFQIEVPDKWNGELVMWAHGYAGVGDTLKASLLPGHEKLVQEGFAWAGSSYSANGWAVRQGSDETRDLAEYFAERFGKPTRIYLVGGSMGGNVVTDSLETYAGYYAGALSLCGVMTGTELFDYFLSYNLAAQYLLGKRWNHNAMANPMPFIGQVAEINTILGTPGNYTHLGKQFDSIIKNLSGGERPFRIEGLNKIAAAGLTFYDFPFGVPLDGVINLAPGKRIASNVDAVYHIDPGLGRTDENLNASIPREAADPAARNAGRNAGYAVPSGNITVPLLSLHTTGDPFVPISLEVSYRKKVDAAGRGNLLVQRAIRAPGHCDFSEAEVLQGFNDLVKWVRDAVRPKGEDFLQPLTDAGREWTNPIRPGDPGGK